MTKLRAWIISAALSGVVACGAGAAQAQSQNWSGFYVGLNVGSGSTSSDFNNTVCTAGSNCYWAGFGPTTGGRVNAIGSGSLDDSAFTFGAQAGYNWQFNTLVLGIEADLNSFRTSASQTASTTYLAGGTTGITFSDSVSTTYLGTARARLGYAAGSVLLYGTGGWAFSNFNHTHSGQEFGFGAGCTATTNFCESGSASTRVGWTLGGGAEWALDRNWSIKGEYLFADFGRTDYGTVLTTGAGVVGHSVDNSLQVGRLGVNYKF